MTLNQNMGERDEKSYESVFYLIDRQNLLQRERGWIEDMIDKQREAG